MKGKIILLGLLFFMLFPLVGSAQYDYNSQEFQTVISQLDMQGHSKDDLATCSVKQLYYEEVREMLNEGMSEEEIIEYYVDQYGQAALKEPGFDSSGLIAWGMPVVGLGAGIVIVAILLKRIKEKKNTNVVQEMHWESETEKEITTKLFDEERRKKF